MNQNHNDHWRPPGAPPQNDAQQQGRPFGGFGPNGPSQPPHVLPPPPPAPHYQHHSQPSGSHSLSIADLTQAPPNQHQYNTQPPPQSQPPSMATLGQHPMPHHSPSYLQHDRDFLERRNRELREQDMREQEMRERQNLEHQRHQEEMMMREREARERERQQMERMHREQQEQQRPVQQSHAGSTPLHQPVANRVQNSIHGPNGLLSNGGIGPTQANGPSSNNNVNIFNTAPPVTESRPTYLHQQGPTNSQQATQPLFGGGPSPLPASAQLPQGQQPILNDALSYLDQVKVRFSDQPEVYNRFLDIMKDFKSQAIDTPGVIDRVSNLFNGHPALIQGFNTFLPPGYRIECGAEGNPDAIRVTTPSGTMTQSLQRGGPFERSNLNSVSQDGFGDARRWSQPLEDNASSLNQQEQRGVSQLQNAATAAQNGVMRATAGSPGPAQQNAFAQLQGGGFGAPDLKRGGPVEFNHAISYVNKIKNRFAQQPDIYKQFLEILQTYQRESKPIQDVYKQVTVLFGEAPDLLEDFKQFLPESAAHAKAQANARLAASEEMSNMRADSYTAGSLPQAQTPRPTAKMPPMGQFDPPSTSKENKKRRTGPSAIQGGSALDLGQPSRGGAGQMGNKRQKLTTQRQPQQDAIMASPTLVPALPEPLPPFPGLTTNEELGFFDRAKKQIGNRSSYAEFLKLINLYTQDLIDKYTLADRVVSFIGSNVDLMQWFRDFLGITEQEEHIELRIKQDPGRVNLSHCRALGPSYRHLPKRDQNKTCKGRDGMCYEVLNDVWASHPTWASEDSGFVAHRKNQYEEALHRIEEERHDYDFHIESCQRTIQLMEPLVQQLGVMNDADRAAFQLALGLGGASEAIPKRIIMKIYGREVGGRVLVELFSKPVLVLPIVLQRLKQKLEEWKSTQREWEKVWRDQINKQFWKSLDHQGINAKNLDKKNFQPKTLVSEIQAKYEEGKKMRENGSPFKKHQLEYRFTDVEVIADAIKLVLMYIASNRTPFSGGEGERVKSWLLDFAPRFFGLDQERFAERVDVDGLVSRDEDMQDGHESDGPGPKPKAKNSLLRKALGQPNGKDDSASDSEKSTPVPTVEHDMDVDEEPSGSDSEDKADQHPWINLVHSDRAAPQVSLEDSYPHTTFNLYANSNIYCFFRLFEQLYSRLLSTKENEQNVVEAVNRHKGADGQRKPAIDLRMIDRGPDEFFVSTIPKEPHHYYHEILRMCEDVVTGSTEQSNLEETLRRYYNKTGWQLYTVDKLVSAIARFNMAILGGDPKDKSVEIATLFFKDRERPDTTRRQEIQYRKQVERFSKDGEVYRISYTPDEKKCTIRLFPSEDPTFDSDALTDDQLWQYYVASYTMTEATEGVDQTAMHFPYLKRNIPPQDANAGAAYAEVYGNLTHYDNQTAFVSPDNYKLLLSSDYIFYREGAKESKKYDASKFEESETFNEKFVRNVAWMKDQSAEDVEARKVAWEKGIKDGLTGFEEIIPVKPPQTQTPV